MVAVFGAAGGVLGMSLGSMFLTSNEPGAFDGRYGAVILNVELSGLLSILQTFIQ